MNRLQGAIALAWAIGIALSFAANALGNFDPMQTRLTLGPALREG